eukprot:TRINITY_DN29248_c0_g1_i1.p1 TRINITY_DN29248_c0_g1~~TRINITY_DN29248_c0_g1_i1.p1  ORF type:complete len:427 (+),score=63.26 TRINITY_DN29248_c0_g1_i1:233-1513(+)
MATAGLMEAVVQPATIGNVANATAGGQLLDEVAQWHVDETLAWVYMVTTLIFSAVLKLYVWYNTVSVLDESTGNLETAITSDAIRPWDRMSEAMFSQGFAAFLILFQESVNIWLAVAIIMAWSLRWLWLFHNYYSSKVSLEDGGHTLDKYFSGVLQCDPLSIYEDPFTPAPQIALTFATQVVLVGFLFFDLEVPTLKTMTVKHAGFFALAGAIQFLASSGQMGASWWDQVKNWLKIYLGQRFIKKDGNIGWGTNNGKYMFGRFLCSFIANQMLARVIIILLPFLLCTADECTDFVKDCLAVVFIVQLDDAPFEAMLVICSADATLPSDENNKNNLPKTQLFLNKNGDEELSADKPVVKIRPAIMRLIKDELEARGEDDFEANVLGAEDEPDSDDPEVGESMKSTKTNDDTDDQEKGLLDDATPREV